MRKNDVITHVKGHNNIDYVNAYRADEFTFPPGLSIADFRQAVNEVYGPSHKITVTYYIMNVEISIPLHNIGVGDYRFSNLIWSVSFRSNSDGIINPRHVGGSIVSDDTRGAAMHPHTPGYDEVMCTDLGYGNVALLQKGNVLAALHDAIGAVSQVAADVANDVGAQCDHCEGEVYGQCATCYGWICRKHMKTCKSCSIDTCPAHRKIVTNSEGTEFNLCLDCSKEFVFCYRCHKPIKRKHFCAYPGCEHTICWGCAGVCTHCREVYCQDHIVYLTRPAEGVPMYYCVNDIDEWFAHLLFGEIVKEHPLANTAVWSASACQQEWCFSRLLSTRHTRPHPTLANKAFRIDKRFRDNRSPNCLACERYHKEHGHWRTEEEFRKAERRLYSESAKLRR